MELQNICGRTNWIRGGTNTGIYIFDNNDVLLIDPGLGGERQEHIIKILRDCNLKVKYIFNTHEHEDHTGGNCQIIDSFSDVKVFSTRRSKIYIENPDIYLDYITGGKRSHILENEIGPYISGGNIIDEIIDSDCELSLDGHVFKFFDISGHTEDGFSILTDDGILFLADLLITTNSLEKFDFLFLADCQKHIDSMENIKNINFDRAILGHSKGVYSKDEVLEIVEYNLEYLYGMIDCFREIVSTPKTLDDIVRDFSKAKGLVMTYVHYLEYRHSLNAVLSYLMKKEEVEYIIDDNIIKYKIK